MKITGLLFYILLILVWGAYYCLPKRFRWILLLAGSVIFYASFGIIPLAVLLASSLLTYLFARLFSKKKSKILLALSIALSLAPILIARAKIVALIGASFYAFSSISYIVECYKDKLLPQKNYAKLLLYVSFFPYIVEGPIARYGRLSNQLYSGNDFCFEDNINGIALILWGIIKKLVIAERIGLLVSTLFSNSDYYSTLYVMLGAFLYAVQLYLDFSGYINIAEGVAAMFSIKLDRNFITPYFSKSISEFWRNWHATLGEWLRDFIYIPLGGNRKGTLRKCANVMAVFIVSGLWHGFTLTFILWGVYHGVLSVIDALIKPVWAKINGIIRTIVTFALVCFGWIFFRAESIGEAFSMIAGIFNFEMVNAEALKVLARNSSLSMYDGKILLVFAIIAVIVEVLDYCKKLTKNTVARLPALAYAAMFIVMIVSIICFAVTDGGAFLYEVF